MNDWPAQAIARRTSARIATMSAWAMSAWEMTAAAVTDLSRTAWLSTRPLGFFTLCGRKKEVR
jgi:hypothetical protein